MMRCKNNYLNRVDEILYKSGSNRMILVGLQKKNGFEYFYFQPSQLE